MKYLFIIILSILPLNQDSFDIDNFQIEEGKLVWQKVYRTELSKDELINQIKNSGEYDNIESNGENLTANISRRELDFKEMGESNSSVPIYIVNSDINAFILFEFKNAKYRVTVKKIVLVQKSTNALSEEGELTNIETFALRNHNTELRKSFLNKPSEILDYTLTKLTKIEKVKQNDKW